jgi:hypothetical protein
MKAESIENAITPLVGLPVGRISRAANMLMIDFGKLQKVPRRGGGIRMVPEFALHVSCVWRLSLPARIVVAYRDFYYSPKGYPLENWDTPGKSRFDRISCKLSRDFKSKPPRVVSVAADDLGGVSLGLSQRYRLDVFPDGSGGTEEDWRLFRPGMDQRHFVVP